MVKMLNPLESVITTPCMMVVIPMKSSEQNGMSDLLVLLLNICSKYEILMGTTDMVRV